MYKDYYDIKALLTAVDADRNIEGANAALANRYPIRFVLFDNFRDSYDFVAEMASRTDKVTSVHEWMNIDCADYMMTYSMLASEIRNFVRENAQSNSVIAPFSALARSTTTMSIRVQYPVRDHQVNEATRSLAHRNGYIPHVVVWKMTRFTNSQINIWYPNADRKRHQQVVIQRNDYHVQAWKNFYDVQAERMA